MHGHLFLVLPFATRKEHVFFVALRTLPPKARAVIRPPSGIEAHERVQQMRATLKAPPALSSPSMNRPRLAIRPTDMADHAPALHYLVTAHLRDPLAPT